MMSVQRPEAEQVRCAVLPREPCPLHRGRPRHVQVHLLAGKLKKSSYFLKVHKHENRIRFVGVIAMFKCTYLPVS
jgi:hypothetical protein